MVVQGDGSGRVEDADTLIWHINGLYLTLLARSASHLIRASTEEDNVQCARLHEQVASGQHSRYVRTCGRKRTEPVMIIALQECSGVCVLQ